MSGLSEDELISEGAMSPDDFYDHIERIQEVASYPLERHDDLIERLEKEAENLLIEPEMLKAAAAALYSGHLVLQGPPGTGKTSLAAALCRAFHCTYLPVTAHENWTTYDVVGRKTLELSENGQERVVAENGFFTEAVIRCAGSIVAHFDSPEEPQATWLVIDELNRANIERAFGEVFSAIGTDELRPTLLSHQPMNNQELVTPRRFRILATLNSVDRQFVNSLGQGLKRRFSFLTVDIPSRRRADEVWGRVNENPTLAAREFSLVIDRAAERIREGLENKDDVRNRLQLLQEVGKPAITTLFDFVEQVRYAGSAADIPYLPIGTAQIIDTVQLFFSRALLEDLPAERLPDTMDWAASLKLAPLFDTDTISPADLEQFANGPTMPFEKHLSKELLQIASAGMHYV